jgi:L-amino acid N-acyltransferase YncA
MGTFETKAPSWEQWDAARFPNSRLVARDRRIVGWAALSPVSKRACYAGVAEVAIYVTALARGRGIGLALLEALIESSEIHGIWTLQGAAIAGNEASLALQARCGFRVVGRRERIGKLADAWHDTILMERRSKRVGIERTN